MISTSAASTQRRSGLAPWRYRPDIDALRGIAVLAVFAYHLDERWLPGGFTGVDVFFVISGYVVSGSLLNHQEQPFWQQLGGFYQRRIRRLVPNLLCNIAVTSLAIALLVPPEESRGLFTTAVKALYGWSNNHLALGATDYFGLDAHLNPLSHTWSLGVEEQFYLVFPLLLLFLGLLPPLLMAVVGGAHRQGQGPRRGRGCLLLLPLLLLPPPLPLLLLLLLLLLKGGGHWVRGRGRFCC